MKAPWVWALVVLLCTLAILVGGERRISCYKCISSSNATGNFNLKGDGCLDPFNHSVRNQDSIVKCAKEAVGCMKMYRKSKIVMLLFLLFSRFLRSIETIQTKCTKFARKKSKI